MGSIPDGTDARLREAQLVVVPLHVHAEGQVMARVTGSASSQRKSRRSRISGRTALSRGDGKVRGEETEGAEGCAGATALRTDSGGESGAAADARTPPMHTK